MLFLIALATAASTLIGGLTALRLKDRLHLILGFSAGAVIGVAFFDLLPEAFELSSDAFTTASLVALGFVAYLVLDRLLSIYLTHSHTGQVREDEHAGHVHAAPERGLVGAAALSTHSFLDGVMIGVAFQVSPAVGAVVTIAVLAHDFSDGINTVNMILKNHGDWHKALRWLIVDALAPALGIIATLFFTLSEPMLGSLLAVFAGFFLYIGASDLVPESHHAHPQLLTTVLTVLGVACMYAIMVN